ELIFLHKMLPGPADKSYGIHVAKLAGLPNDLLSRAAVILDRLEQKEEIVLETTVQTEEFQTNKTRSAEKETAVAEEAAGQLSLFGMADENESSILKALNELNLLTMSPLEALNVLHELQQQLK